MLRLVSLNYLAQNERTNGFVVNDPKVVSDCFGAAAFALIVQSLVIYPENTRLVDVSSCLRNKLIIIICMAHLLKASYHEMYPIKWLECIAFDDVFLNQPIRVPKTQS